MKSRIDIERLSNIPLFQGLKTETLEFILSKISQSKIFHRFFPNGDLIADDGETATSMFIILSGSVEIRRNNEFLVGRGANEVIGEQALIDDTVRSAAMYAQGSVELLELSYETFNALTEMDSQFCKNMLKVLSEKLRQSTHERGRRFVHENRLMRAFREHVSPLQLDELLASEQYEDFLKPQHLLATALFSDIRDFTTRTESLDAITLAKELNDYFSSAVSIIHQHEGIVDKFLGDGVMAIWGIIQPKKDDTEKAVACGLKLIENAPHYSLGGKSIQIGVGIATGKIFYGHIGNATKRQLTVLGDPVNMASRLEEKTKEVGVPIIVDAQTFKKVKEQFPLVPIGTFKLKGKSQPVEGYMIEQLAKKSGKIYSS